MDPKYIPDEMAPNKEKKRRTDRPIPPEIYPVVDNDLARDNLENDLTEADLQDL